MLVKSKQLPQPPPSPDINTVVKVLMQIADKVKADKTVELEELKTQAKE